MGEVVTLQGKEKIDQNSISNSVASGQIIDFTKPFKADTEEKLRFCITRSIFNLLEVPQSFYFEVVEDGKRILRPTPLWVLSHQIYTQLFHEYWEDMSSFIEF